MTACRVCDGRCERFGETLVLGRHRVRYDRCTSCGSIQTETPYWLEEAYSTALVRADVGAVQRNLELSEKTQAILSSIYGRGPSRFLDYGGGHGLFVRLMRDRGFDFYWSDKYASNDYANGFEAPASAKFSLMTAFEVFEHLPDPFAEVANMQARSDAILFSTELLPDPAPTLDAWWYYALFGGQHVQLYTRLGLQRLGERFGLSLLSDGRTLHLYYRGAAPLSDWAFRLLARRQAARFVNRLRPRASLQPADYRRFAVASRMPDDPAGTARSPGAR